MKKFIMAALLGAAAVAVNAAAPAVRVTQEEGFVDLQFRVQKVELLEDGTRSVVVQGSLDGKSVALPSSFVRTGNASSLTAARILSIGGAGV